MLSSYTHVKVFAASKSVERGELGDKVTQWLAENPGIELVEKEVRQSSDDQFHCLTITLFYRLSAPASTATA